MLEGKICHFSRYKGFFCDAYKGKVRVYDARDQIRSQRVLYKRFVP